MNNDQSTLFASISAQFLLNIKVDHDVDWQLGNKPAVMRAFSIFAYGTVFCCASATFTATSLAIILGNIGIESASHERRLKAASRTRYLPTTVQLIRSWGGGELWCIGYLYCESINSFSLIPLTLFQGCIVQAFGTIFFLGQMLTYLILRDITDKVVGSVVFSIAALAFLPLLVGPILVKFWKYDEGDDFINLPVTGMKKMK